MRQLGSVDGQTRAAGAGTGQMKVRDRGDGQTRERTRTGHGQTTPVEHDMESLAKLLKERPARIAYCKNCDQEFVDDVPCSCLIECPNCQQGWALYRNTTRDKWAHIGKSMKADGLSTNAS